MKISIYARYNLATGFHIHDIIIQQEAMKPHSQYYAHFIIPWRMLQRYDIVNCLKMKKNYKKPASALAQTMHTLSDSNS